MDILRLGLFTAEDKGYAYPELTLLTCLVASLLAATSCSKTDDDQEISDVYSGLQNSWYAISSKDDSNTLVYAEGNTGITLILKDDNTFVWQLNYTSSKAVPVTYRGTWSYRDRKLTLIGSAAVAGYRLSMNDVWTIMSITKNRLVMECDTHVASIGYRTMVWGK